MSQLDRELSEYLETMVERPGRSERRRALELYLTGLLLDAKYALCSLPADTSRKKLVRLWKLRWRVERDYQEMKQEVGLDHFEGCSWRGFHHHATLCSVSWPLSYVTK
ncbi:hypothetical protein BON30_01600 [Cystobacter ferrugineus]|uniref:Transposase IS4-like domain-containing protein n=1 Tax=Cystobacter ferrugineus TaxID=83449 RepID=A0A1L9BI41_9BACT|nr:hypothetical protein BON30_01600 [Cystobacter ferrugineus]